MQDLLSTLLAELPAALLGILATALIAWFTFAPRLRVFLAPMAELDIPADANQNRPATNFRIESLLIRNNNFSRAVSDIEITLAFRPADFSIKPHVPHSDETLKNGHWVVKLEKVQPQEQIKIDIAYFGQNAPTVMSIRSSEGPKILEPAVYNSIIPRWRSIAVLIFAAVGVFTIWRLIWETVGLLWSLVPPMS